MVSVLGHGDTTAIRNPLTGKYQEMVNVILVEEGRSGANESMFETSLVLSNYAGKNVGLENFRVHTHPVTPEEAREKFFVGAEINDMFINRKLFSTPQMRQQVNLKPRMVEGRPTFFTTYASDVQKDDVDLRIPNEVLITVRPDYFFDSVVGATDVRVVSSDSRNGVRPTRESGTGNQGGTGPRTEAQPNQRNIPEAVDTGDNRRV